MPRRTRGRPEAVCVCGTAALTSSPFPVVRRFEGQVVLVTGGSDGIGLATAQRFVEEGATVVVTGRDAGRLREAQSLLGPAALVAACDVCDLAQLEALYERIRVRFGRLDVVFAEATLNKSP